MKPNCAKVVFMIGLQRKSREYLYKYPNITHL